MFNLSAMWWKFVWRTTPLYGNSLAILTWKAGEGGGIGWPTPAIWRKSLLLPCLSCGETAGHGKTRNSPGSSNNSKRICPAPYLYRPVSQLLGVGAPLLKRGFGGYTPQCTLWFYLHDHREDMRKWDGKSISTPKAQVHELQGKTVTWVFF